jgi:hypothetical protein
MIRIRTVAEITQVVSTTAPMIALRSNVRGRLPRSVEIPTPRGATGVVTRQREIVIGLPLQHKIAPRSKIGTPTKQTAPLQHGSEIRIQWRNQIQKTGLDSPARIEVCASATSHRLERGLHPMRTVRLPVSKRWEIPIRVHASAKPDQRLTHVAHNNDPLFNQKEENHQVLVYNDLLFRWKEENHQEVPVCSDPEVVGVAINPMSIKEEETNLPLPFF